VRILIRPRLPVLALLLLAPAIPELLTGSTPVSEIFYDPLQFFFVSFPLDILLYGFGALLIREFAVAYRKGWASILLLGAAYGIAEEGFEVHTFFKPSGPPVDALASYGHLFGVNWLWALVITVFHATYSIALPILLTNLWFPEAKEQRWFDPGAIRLMAGIYLLEVVGFGFIVGYGPSLPVLAFFVGVVGLLIALALWAPQHLLSPRPGRRRIGRNSLVLLGAGGFTVYFIVLFLSDTQPIPAVAAAIFFVLADAGLLWGLLRSVGTEGLERSEFYFAVGMLSVLFVWDVLIEFIGVPGILGVTAIFVYLLVRLDRTLSARARSGLVPAGAAAPPLRG
jgi:hypothetical protein